MCIVYMQQTTSILLQQQKKKRKKKRENNVGKREKAHCQYIYYTCSVEALVRLHGNLFCITYYLNPKKLYHGNVELKDL